MKLSARTWGGVITLLIALLMLDGLLPFKKALAAGSGPKAPEDLETVLEKKRFNINIRNGDLKDLLRIIADRSGLDTRFDGPPDTRVSAVLRNVTLAEALDHIADKNGLEYSIDDERIVIRKLDESSQQASSTSPSGRYLSGVSDSGTGMNGVREISLQYAQASILVEQLRPLAGPEVSMVVDQLANSILFQGSEQAYERLKGIIKVLDRLPQQVLIEAQIVETSRNFLQAFGLSWGLTKDPSLSNSTAKTGFVVSTAGPSAPNAAIRYAISQDWGGIPLDVRLNAAETNGDAKVISRPKVVTLNNTPANIQSGISFNVKTLSTVSTGGGGSGVAAGGVATLNAGLTLNVTPTIMGTDLVKLNVVINNSQPDESQIVDGIPGIVNNSATTSVIVNEGRTAVIAGLVKNSGGKAEASVPLLSKVPILGALFRNSNVSDRNNELVIFITPQIVSASSDLRPTQKFSEGTRAAN